MSNAQGNLIPIGSVLIYFSLSLIQQFSDHVPQMPSQLDHREWFIVIYQEYTRTSVAQCTNSQLTYYQLKEATFSQISYLFQEQPVTSLVCQFNWPTIHLFENEIKCKFKRKIIVALRWKKMVFSIALLSTYYGLFLWQLKGIQLNPVSITHIWPYW